MDAPLINFTIYWVMALVVLGVVAVIAYAVKSLM